MREWIKDATTHSINNLQVLGKEFSLLICPNKYALPPKCSEPCSVPELADARIGSLVHQNQPMADTTFYISNSISVHTHTIPLSEYFRNSSNE